MSEEEILSKMEQGKKFMKQEQYSEAKDAFLDAAEISLALAKKSDKQEKYRNIANRLVQFAKEAQERINFKKLEKETETDLPDISDDFDFPEPPSDIEREMKKNVSSFSKFKSKIPPEVMDYKLPKKQDLKVVLGYNEASDQIWNPAKLMNGIMMITGGSGSGKTEWLRSAIKEITTRGYPTVIFDLHGDILDESSAIPSFAIDYQGKYGVNPMELLSHNPSDGGPLPQINRLLKMFDDAISDGFSPNQLAYLRSMLHVAYNSAGIKQEDPKSWNNPPPTFSFLRDILINPEHILQPLDKMMIVQDMLATNSSTIAAVKNRLLPILEHPAFRAEYVIPIEKMLEVPIRIVLKSLQTVDMQFIVADTILRHLFSKIQSLGHIKSGKDRDKFRLFAIIDEVKILSGNRGDVNDNYHILNRLATEARKYGMGLLLASQVIRHFGRDIRANAASKLVLRPMDIDEAKSNGKELEVKYEDLLDINKPGEGFYRATNLDEAISLQLYPSTNRPIKSFSE